MLFRVWLAHLTEKKCGSIVRRLRSQIRQAGMLEVDLAMMHSHLLLARFGYLGRSASWRYEFLPAYVVEVVSAETKMQYMLPLR